MNAPEGFAADYVITDVDLPSSGVDREFAAPGADGRRRVIRFEPNEADSWIASFAAPRPGVRSLSAFLATPDPARACIVERGSAFIGDVRTGDGFELVVDAGPMVQATALRSAGLLLLHTPWTLVAIDHAGVRWESPRLAIDGFQLTGLELGRVVGLDPDDGGHPFTVDLETGETDVGGRSSSVSMGSDERYPG